MPPLLPERQQPTSGLNAQRVELVHRRRRQKKPRAPAKAVPRSRLQGSRPVPDRQIMLCERRPAPGNCFLPPAARSRLRPPPRPAASIASIRAGRSCALSPKDAAGLKRKHKQEKDEIDHQGPLLAPVTAGQTLRHAQYQSAKRSSLNRPHSTQDNDNESFKRVIVTHCRKEVEHGKQEASA